MGCGTLLQIVAYGSQDIYLTGNPQITYFKAVYKRYTNFAIESVQQNFIGGIKLQNGNANNIKTKGTLCKYSSIINRVGDLLLDMHIELDISQPTEKNEFGDIILSKFVKRPAYALIDFIELEIGGQIIDKQYGEWMDIWSQLTHTYEQYTKLERLVNCKLKAYNKNNLKKNIFKMYIPLKFWFSKNPGLAIPIIALKYNEIKFNISFKKNISIVKKQSENNTIITPPLIDNINLYCDYIFLDTDERRQIAMLKNEYLIEQVQFRGNYTFDKEREDVNIDLNFNHPVKELVFLCQDNDLIDPTKSKYAPFAYNISNNGGDLVKNARILFNNNDRFSIRESSYFRLVQPYQHHIGGYDHDKNNDNEKGYFYIYSFGLNPGEYQPSGSCNFSRIDIAQLILKLNHSIGDTKSIRIYAINYNVFQIYEGVGSLLYLN